MIDIFYTLNPNNRRSKVLELNIFMNKINLFDYLGDLINFKENL